jgi:hypothetical protein
MDAGLSYWKTLIHYTWKIHVGIDEQTACSW